jgi:hypothetical protein
MASATHMPVGSPMTLPIRATEVETTEGNERAPVFSDDATAALVWNDYQRAKAYVESENTAWLLEWAGDRHPLPVADSVPLRAVAVGAAGACAALSGRQDDADAGAGRETLSVCRAVSVSVAAGRQGDAAGCRRLDLPDWRAAQAGEAALPRRLADQWADLFGTGLGKFGVDERKVVKKTRRRKSPPQKIDQPTGPVTVPTEQSDAFESKETTVTETWPFYEYRKLGTTLFDPKWCTPDLPDESAGYCIDIDYVSFYDLQEMRALSCYQEKKDADGETICAGIPDEATLKQYFFERQQGNAPIGTQTEDGMSSSGSMVTHAAARNRQTSIDPMSTPLLMLERWDGRTVRTILCYDGQQLPSATRSMSMARCATRPVPGGRSRIAAMAWALGPLWGRISG